MSRSGRKRSSKWDLINEAQSPNEREHLPMSFHDGGSDRHSSRISSGTKDAKWSMMDSSDKEPLPGGRFSKNDADYSAAMEEWEGEGNYSMKRSPGIDEWRKRSRSCSPKGRRSRPLRSRSRSRSPAHGYRRESAVSDRSRSKPSAPPCRDFSAGRCRNGDHCHFVHHNNNHNFEDRRYPENNSTDVYESRYRNNNDTMDHSHRAGRSDQICNDFLNGRCQRGQTCRYVHDRPSDEFNMGSAEDMTKERERDDERKSRGPSSEHGGWRGPHKTTAEVPCKFFASGNCRNGDNCRFSHYTPPNSSSDGRSQDDRLGKGHRSNGADQNRESKWNNNTELVNGSKSSEGEYRRQGVSESRFSHKDDERDRNFDKNKTIETNEKEFVLSKTENTELKGTEAWLGDMEMSPEWNYRRSPIQAKKEESGYINQISQSLNHNDKSFLPTPNVNIIREVSNQIIHDATAVHPNMFEKTYVQQYPRPNDDAIHAFPFNGQGAYDNSAVQRQQILPLDSSNGENNKFPQNLTPFQDGKSTERRDLVDTSASHVITEVPSMQNTVPNEQIAQLTNLSAMLPQIYAALNPPNTMDSLPSISHSVEAASTQPSASFLSSKQYDPISDSIKQIKADVNTHPPLFSQNAVEQKCISNGDDDKDENDLMKRPKEVTNSENKENNEKGNEENKKLESESKKPREHSPVNNVDEEGEADEGKKSKDGKVLRVFKFALAEFVKELLKPSWKEGRINKEAYKTIVKKVMDKVTGTIQGTHVPQTQEKIDQYLSVSKPKLTKLVQAYVDKHQKAEKK